MFNALRASPPGPGGDQLLDVRGEIGLERLRAPPYDLAERVDRVSFELVDLCARQECRVDLEVRVLRRRADQGQQPVLDTRQQRILLGLVEPVDLVEEQDRPPCRSRRGAPARGRAPRGRSRRSPTRRRALRSRPPSSGPRCARGSSCRSPAGRRGSSTAPGPARSRGAARDPARSHGPGPRSRRGSAAAAAGRGAPTRRAGVLQPR